MKEVEGSHGYDFIGDNIDTYICAGYPDHMHPIDPRIIRQGRIEKHGDRDLKRIAPRYPFEPS